MATNAIVLIVVTAMALLLLASVVVGVVYKTRAGQRYGKNETIRDQAGEDTLRLRRQETLANESAAKAHAAQVEADIETDRACGLQRQATVRRREAATYRDQLNVLRGNADKLTAAGRPPTLPRLVG